MPSSAMKKPALQRNKSMDKGFKTGGMKAKIAKKKSKPKKPATPTKPNKKKQGYKSRRDESKGMEKAMGRRAYASVGTMDKGKKKKG